MGVESSGSGDSSLPHGNAGVEGLGGSYRPGLNNGVGTLSNSHRRAVRCRQHDAGTDSYVFLCRR